MRTKTNASDAMRWAAAADHQCASPLPRCPSNCPSQGSAGLIRAMVVVIHPSRLCNRASQGSIRQPRIVDLETCNTRRPIALVGTRNAHRPIALVGIPNTHRPIALVEILIEHLIAKRRVALK